MSGGDGKSILARVPWPKPDTAAAWAAASAAILGAAAAKPLIDMIMGAPAPPYITFYPAVVIAALAGGPRIGLISAGVAVLAAWYFFLPEQASWRFADRPTAMLALTFALTSTFLGWVVGRARIALDAAVANQAERDKAARESVHRIKNLLAVVQGIAMKVSREVDSVESYRDVLMKRLIALDSAQAVLIRKEWQDLEVAELIEAALAPFLPNPRLRVVPGPSALTPARFAQGLSMALYELCTNALKYGALGKGGAPVVLSWRVDGGNVVLEWSEESAAEARSQGLGARLIQAALQKEPGASVQYQLGQDGVRAEFRWPAPATA